MTPHAQSRNESSGPGSLKREYLSKTYTVCSRFVLPHHYKNIEIHRGYLTKIFCACGVIDTECTICVFENRSHLDEFEAEFKKALARESGAQGVLVDKKPKVENLVTLSL
jgi:hypothetical protein